MSYWWKHTTPLWPLKGVSFELFQPELWQTFGQIRNSLLPMWRFPDSCGTLSSFWSDFNFACNWISDDRQLNKRSGLLSHSVWHAAAGSGVQFGPKRERLCSINVFFIQNLFGIDVNIKHAHSLLSRKLVLDPMPIRHFLEQSLPVSVCSKANCSSSSKFFISFSAWRICRSRSSLIFCLFNWILSCTFSICVAFLDCVSSRSAVNSKNRDSSAKRFISSNFLFLLTNSSVWVTSFANSISSGVAWASAVDDLSETWVYETAFHWLSFFSFDEETNTVVCIANEIYSGILAIFIFKPIGQRVRPFSLEVAIEMHSNQQYNPMKGLSFRKEVTGPQPYYRNCDANATFAYFLNFLSH